MTGRLPGVNVLTTDGSPDAEVVIRVRGGGSITQDNSPLFVVDGFIVSSIRDIPPTDIESINILKDASATAIYGAQAANGVVVITTKQPEAGKISVSYNGHLLPRACAILFTPKEHMVTAGSGAEEMPLSTTTYWPITTAEILGLEKQEEMLLPLPT